MTYGGWQEDCQPLPVCMTEKARPSTAPAKLPFSGPHHPDIKKDGRPPVERPSVFSLQIPSLHNAGEQHHVPTVHGTMLQPPRQSASGREPGRERPFLMNVRPQGSPQGCARWRRRSLTGIDSNARPQGSPQGCARWRRRSLTGIDSNARPQGSPQGCARWRRPALRPRQQRLAIARRTFGRCRRRAARALRVPCRGRPPYGVR